MDEELEGRCDLVEDVHPREPGAVEVLGERGEWAFCAFGTGEDWGVVGCTGGEQFEDGQSGQVWRVGQGRGRVLVSRRLRRVIIPYRLKREELTTFERAQPSNPDQVHRR